MSTSTPTKPSISPWPNSMEQKRPVEDLLCYIRQYAQDKPDQAALWCFGIGFVLGWKLKPW